MDLVDILQSIGFDFRIFLFNLINFIIIGSLLYKFFFKKIFAVIEERQNIIEEGIKNKEKAAIMLEETEKEKEKVLIKARMEAFNYFEEKKKEANIISDKIILDSKNQSIELLEKTKKEIEQLKKENIRTLKKNAIEVVLNATKKLAANSNTGNLSAQQAEEALKNIEVKTE